MARPGQTNETRLIKALTVGDDEAALEYVAKGINPAFRDAAGWTPLMWAAYGECTETIKALTTLGCDPNARATADGRTAMMIAAEEFSGHDTLDILLKSGADPALRDLAGKTALDIAREVGNRKAQGALDAHAQEAARLDAAKAEKAARTKRALDDRQIFQARLKRLDALAIPRRKIP